MSYQVWRGVLALTAIMTAVSARSEVLLKVTFNNATLDKPMTYSVYFPPGYRATERRLPVLYLLHGLGDNATSWVKAGQVETLMDQAIASGQAQPMLVVMPDAARSWYVDSAAVGGPGDYAKAIGDDLVAHVDSVYSTRAEPAARAIAGHSMGALGALHIGFARPTRFGTVAAMNLSPGPGLIERLRAGGSVSDERARRMFDSAFGVPFRRQRFLAAMPEAQVANLNPQAPPRIYLHASDDDPWDTHLRTVDLYRALKNRGIEAELRITDGKHVWSVWRRELPRIAAFFSVALKDNTTD